MSGYEEVIYIDDDILRDAYQTYNKNSVEFSSLSSDISESGDINVQSGLFGDGINKLSNQSTAISSRFDSISSIVSSGIDEWNLLERKLANEAMSIEIPKIEGLTDSIANYQYSDSTLSKNDGRSVNDGQGTSLEKYDDSSTVDKEQLQDITKGDTILQEYVDDYNFNNQHNKVLEDITTNGGAEEQVYDDAYNYNNQNNQALVDITTSGGVEEQKYDDAYNYNNQNNQALADITTNGGATEQEFDDSYDISNQNNQALADITTSGGTIEQEYDSSSIIQQANLGNINNDNQQIEQQLDTSNSAVKNVNLVNIN